MQSNTQTPLVSTIIAAYNGAAFIEEAIDSALSQNYPSHEILVIDNGSTDETAEIAQSYKQIRYFHLSEPNVNHARNLGVQKALGKYVAFLDQDDCWCFDKLSCQVAFLESSPAYQAVIGLQKMYLQEGCSKPHWLKSEFLKKPQPAFLPSALLAHKSLFLKTGLFNDSFLLTSDVAWFFKAKNLGVSIHILDRVLLHRRIHNQNASNHCTEIQKEILTIIRYSLKEKREKQENDDPSPKLHIPDIS